MNQYIYQRPWLYPKQAAAIFDGVDHKGAPARMSFVEASTKAGKTSACLAWLFEQAILNGRDGRNYWWVAPVYLQAKIAFRRMKRAIPRWLYGKNESELSITLINGATIWFRSGDNPDNLYGEDVHAAVVDEASRVKEDAWHAIRSVLTATRGRLRAIGNVKGRKNWFYRLAREAEAGADGHSYAKLTAWDAVAGGVLASDEIESAQRVLPENVFRELYLAEASDDGGNPFGLDHIRACVAPLSTDKTFAAGVDLAKSVDFCVVIGLDKRGATTGFDRWRRLPWSETEKRILESVGRIPTKVDSTGVGDPVVERLQSHPGTKFERVVFTATTKQQLMEGLAASIQNHEISFPDGPIRAELENFEYVYTRLGVRYSAPSGYHDDCVMALALADAMRRQRLPLVGAVKPAGPTKLSSFLNTMTGTGANGTISP